MYQRSLEIDRVENKAVVAPDEEKRTGSYSIGFV